MITSVKIKDNTKTPFEYVSNIEAFENGREFIFKPGVNVIIGKNGSGKSTLLNIISMYALCEKSMCSEIPIEALDFPPIFDDDDDKVLEVLAYHPGWIDEDFNPRGIRIGFWNGGDDFKSAHWWDYQDCYITISHCDCDDNSLFSDRIKNSIEPELWISLDVITNYLPNIKQNHLSQ